MKGLRIFRSGRRMRGLGRIEKDVLEELSLGDVLYAGLLSPRSTKIFYKLARERANQRYRRKRAIERLMEQRFIETRGDMLSLTSRGKSVLGTLISETLRTLGKVTWDGKWRLVTFDIPEKYAGLRTKVRLLLKKAGFVKLQQSIWVFPHECNELAQLIKEESGLSKYILYGVLERIENDGRLKKLFKL